jgi:hypothetical protein
MHRDKIFFSIFFLLLGLLAVGSSLYEEQHADRDPAGEWVLPTAQANESRSLATHSTEAPLVIEALSSDKN